MPLESRLAGRPVFVTGADGFGGSHLVDRLIALGADVHVFVRAASSGGLNNTLMCSTLLISESGSNSVFESVSSRFTQEFSSEL